MSHGVRKVNEYLISDGRALIITELLDLSSDIDIWSSIANGSLYVNPEEGTLKFKKINSAKGVWSTFSASGIIRENSIVNNLLADYSIDGEKIAAGAISTRNIENYAITGEKIMNESVTEKHIAKGSLTGKVFIDNSISGIKIVDYSIDGSKITQRSLDKFALKLGTLTGDEIKDKSIPSYKLISVDGSIIENNSIDGDKLKNNSINGRTKILSNSITNSELGEKCIKNYNLSLKCIDSENLMDGVVTKEKYADLSIYNDKIANNTIEGSKLALKTIKGDNIAYTTINKENLSIELQNSLDNVVLYENGVAQINGDARVTGNIYAATDNCSQNITGFKVFNPVFKDFAEAFEYVEVLSYGDIVEITDDGKVKKATPNSTKVIGVVSNSYAMCFGATSKELDEKSKMPIGLLGQVYVNIVGSVEAGDFIISCGEGIGKAIKPNGNYERGSVVGKALETNNNNDIKKVLCLVCSF